MTAAGKRRLAGLAALIVAGSALAYLAFGGIEKNLVYYWTPSDLLSRADKVGSATVRLGGMVQQGSLDWDAASLRLRFTLGEQIAAGGPSIAVVSTGAPPQMFREGIGCVVEGTFDGKVFHTDRLLVKHSNEYHPPAKGDDPRELYKTLQTDQPQPGALREAPAAPPATPEQPL